MHRKGYNCFTIPKLSPIEIMDLIKGNNLNEKKQKETGGKKKKKW